MRRVTAWSVLAMSAGCLMMCGCTTVGRKIDANAVDRIKVGVTTREEVRQSLGSPDQITRNNNDVTYMYMYARAEATPESYIPVVGGLMGGTKTQNQSVMVTFGPDDIVKNVNSSMGGMESGDDLAAGHKAKLSETEDNKRDK